jgi:hypothetical protein
MSTAESVLSWASGLGFAAGFGVMMFSLERMRQQVNRMLPPDQRIQWGGRNAWRTFGMAKFDFCFEVLDKHRESYPASRLRQRCGFGLLGMMLAFGGLGLSVFL